jgi:hypothetical protein
MATSTSYGAAIEASVACGIEVHERAARRIQLAAARVVRTDALIRRCRMIAERIDARRDARLDSANDPR